MVLLKAIKDSVDATQDEWMDWILCELKVDRELDRVKSLKLGFYGHTTQKYESLEKQICLLYTSDAADE